MKRKFKFKNLDSNINSNNNYNPNNIMNKTFYNTNHYNHFLNNKSKSSKIQFSLTMGQSYNIAGNASDTFQSILDEFLKDNNLLNFRNKIVGAIFEAKKLEFNKTLSENNIKEGSVRKMIKKNH